MTDPAVERVRALLDLREGQANTGGRGLVDDDGYVCVRVDDVRAMLPPVLTPAVPLREAEDEESALRQRMADLLTRTANALKGDPGPLRSWSWHDLPEVADDLAAARAEVARLREAVEGRAVIDLHGATVHGRLSVPDIGHFTLARGRFEACSDCTHFPEVTCVDLGTPSSTSFSGPR